MKSLNSLGSIHLDYLSLTGRARDCLACLVHALDVEGDGFADKPKGLLTRFACGNAAGEVRHVSAPSFLTLLDDDQVLHRDLT